MAFGRRLPFPWESIERQGRSTSPSKRAARQAKEAEFYFNRKPFLRRISAVEENATRRGNEGPTRRPWRAGVRTQKGGGQGSALRPGGE